MCEKCILELTYGTITLYNLECTWIQRLTMRPGYMLCYKDDKYERGTIYRSTNKAQLIEIQDKLMKKYNKGKKLIKLK